MQFFGATMQIFIIGVKVIVGKTVSAFTDTTATNGNGYYVFSYQGQVRYKIAASTEANDLDFAYNGASLNLPGGQHKTAPSTTYDFVGIMKSRVKPKSTGRTSAQTL